jgi:hypothetical protein
MAAGPHVLHCDMVCMQHGIYTVVPGPARVLGAPVGAQCTWANSKNMISQPNRGFRAISGRFYQKKDKQSEAAGIDPRQRTYTWISGQQN